VNWNPAENCFLTSFHPSIVHGALLGAGSLWPQFGSAKVVINKHFVNSSGFQVVVGNQLTPLQQLWQECAGYCEQLRPMNAEINHGNQHTLASYQS
jgi:hypothetical protein